MRIEGLALILFAWLMPLGGIAGDPEATAFDRQVESLEITSEGEYAPGFMFWYGRGLFPFWAWEVPELILLGEVTDVEEQQVESDIRGSTAHGHLRVLEIVRCPQRVHKQVERIRTLRSDALTGLEPGDRVLVCMVAYEGQYAIPSFFGTNCAVGHRVSSHHERELVALLAQDRGWRPGELTADELRLWAEINPHSVATWLIDHFMPDP